LRALLDLRGQFRFRPLALFALIETGRAGRAELLRHPLARVVRYGGIGLLLAIGIALPQFESLPSRLIDYSFVLVFLIVAVAVVAGFMATAAQATPIVPHFPITTPPLPVTAVGDVKAMYIFSDASDASNLLQTIPPFPGVIFCNHSNGLDGGCSGPPATFTTVDLGVESGTLQFELHNVSQGTTYFSDTPDGTADHAYHAFFTTNFSDITGVSAPAGMAAQLAAAGMTGTITFVAWEDRNINGPGTDYDYNDLIFAFSNIAVGCTESCPVPEPLTLSLFGAGLAGAAAFRRRRKSQNAA